MRGILLLCVLLGVLSSTFAFFSGRVALRSAAVASSFPVSHGDARCSRALHMGLDPALAKAFPRDFSKIPVGTDYGTADFDEPANRAVERRRMDYLEAELSTYLKEAAASKERPMFTTALIAGDAVILDALHKAGLLSGGSDNEPAPVPVVFVDTYTLFPESLAHLREVEAHYGFKAQIYAAAGCTDQKDYQEKYGRDYWMKDIDA